MNKNNRKIKSMINEISILSNDSILGSQSIKMGQPGFYLNIYTKPGVLEETIPLADNKDDTDREMKNLFQDEDYKNSIHKIVKIDEPFDVKDIKSIFSSQNMYQDKGSLKFIFVEEGMESGDTTEVYTVKESEIRKWAENTNMDEYEAIELLAALKGASDYDNDIIDNLQLALDNGDINIESANKEEIEFDDFGEISEPENCTALYPAF